jgi:tripartite ATP-independent transporter DctP family solute receptor
MADLPFLFDGLEHARAAMDGKFGAWMTRKIEERIPKYKVLGYFENGYRHVSNKLHPVRALADLKGMKVRLMPGPIHAKSFELQGAVPFSLDLKPGLEAVVNGTVDAQENPITLIYASKFFEVQKHLSLTQHAYTVSIVAMNLAKFNGLSPDQQGAFLEAAKEAAAYQRKMNRDIEGENLAKMKQAGLAVVEKVDPKPFQDLLGDKIKKTYVDRFGPELVEAIEKAKP